jgi:hypothetical protein
MHCSGVHRPRWKLNEKMIRVARCMRHQSMPMRSSGDRGKPMSQRASSQ